MIIATSSYSISFLRADFRLSKDLFRSTSGIFQTCLKSKKWSCYLDIKNFFVTTINSSGDADGFSFASTISKKF